MLVAVAEEPPCQVSAPRSSPATCWPPAVVTPGEAALVGLARPGFRTPGRIANDFSAAAAVCWPGPTNWAKARRLADLQVAPEAPSAGSPRFPGPPSVAPELTRPGIEAQDGLLSWHRFSQAAMGPVEGPGCRWGLIGQ